MDLKIHEPFRDLIPPLKPEELDELEKSLLFCGCLSPIVVWKGRDIIVDGHHRFDLCQEHGLQYLVEELTFRDEKGVERWIIQNQLARRNLDAEQVSLYRGMLYREARKATPNPEGAGGKSRKIVKGHSDPKQSTAEKIAAQSGVSPATVKRDAKFADAVDTLGVQSDVMAGKMKGKRKEIIAKAAAKKGKPAPKKSAPPRMRPRERAASAFNSLTDFNKNQVLIEVIRSLPAHEQHRYLVSAFWCLPPEIRERFLGEVSGVDVVPPQFSWQRAAGES